MQEHIDSVPPKAEKEILSPFLFFLFSNVVFGKRLKGESQLRMDL